MRLKIFYYDHPILRTHCKPIARINDEIRQLANDMIETMYASDGVGLAAPQVGYAVRLFVLRDYEETEEGQWIFSQPKVYINPKLTDPGLRKLKDIEGCLSIPGLRLEVERPDKITVTALNLEGEWFTEEVGGYNARIRMHENDHLNGVLFIDRASKSIRQQAESILRECKRKYPHN